MDSALLVNTEGPERGVVVVGVLLGDGLGPVLVMALEQLVGGVVGGVVGLPVERRPGDQRRAQFDQQEADEGDPHDQLDQPPADQGLRLTSWRVKKFSSSTPRARAMAPNDSTPAPTAATTRPARARPRSPGTAT